VKQGHSSSEEKKYEDVEETKETKPMHKFETPQAPSNYADDDSCQAKRHEAAFPVSQL